MTGPCVCCEIETQLDSNERCHLCAAVDWSGPKQPYDPASIADMARMLHAVDSHRTAGNTDD